LLHHRDMKLVSCIAVAVLLPGVAGCLEGEEDEGGTVADSRCATGLRWSGGDAESPNMHPGGDCIGCHAQRGEGPHYSVAGTVHLEIDEPIDCLGIPGVTVSVTDANANTIDLVTNSSGNFFTRQSLTMPVQIRLSYEGRERLMGLQPPVGACATCHTESGLNAAPGRIIAP